MAFFKQKPKVKVTRQIYQYLVVINGGGTYFEQTFAHAPIVNARADQGCISVYSNWNQYTHWSDNQMYLVFEASYSPSTGDNFRVKKQLVKEIEEWV